MHPHLHTKDNRACEEVMILLEECHARGFLWKAFGNCNDAKKNVNICLRAERLERSRLNREKAKVRREQYEKAWKDVDENS